MVRAIPMASLPFAQLVSMEFSVANPTTDSSTKITTFTVRGGDETETVLGGLMELLKAVRGGAEPVGPPDSAAVPIRGQGATLGAVFAELARDLLAQLDVQGDGLTHVRLDGLLRGDDGYVGWGYLEGAATGGGAAIGVDLAGEPVTDRSDEGISLSFDLRTPKST